MNLHIHRVGPHSELLEEFPLAAWHSLHFGTAGNADVRLTPHPALPQDCLRVWQDADRYLAESLTGQRRFVILNGQPLDSIVELERGDTIEIGSDRFLVTTADHRRPQIADASPPAAAAQAPAVSHELMSVKVNGCLRQHTPVDPVWSDAGVLQQLCDEHQAFLFANFQHAGMTGSRPDFAGDDLYAHAPDEVRAVYSLHAISDCSTAQKLQIYAVLRNSDAVVCVVPDADLETCLNDAKIYLAWFARPSVLEMTLSKGSRQLAEKLIRPFKALMFAPRDGRHEWVIYTKADFDVSEFRLSAAAT